MKNTKKIWICVCLALTLGWVSGYLVARGTVESWHNPPPPPELVQANARLHEHCKLTLYRMLRCTDRTDLCMCQQAPPELLKEFGFK